MGLRNALRPSRRDAHLGARHFLAGESEGLGREYEGSGLVLTVARSLTEKMGGRIEVDTEKEEGARFTLRLPLSPGRSSEPPPTGDASSERPAAEAT